MKSICAWILLAGLLVFGGCRARSEPESTGEDRLLGQWIDQYLKERFHFYPAESTEAGVHDYDGELGRYSEKDFAARLEWLRDFQQKLLAVELTALSRDAYFDALQILAAVRAEIHEIEGRERWRREPAWYARAITEGLWSLGGREFGTPHERLRSLATRLRAVPALAGAARANLDHPAPVAIEAGLTELARADELIRDLPKLFAHVTDEQLMAELGSAVDHALRATSGLATHLRDLLPTARGTGALGEEKLRTLLLYQEMEDAPLAELRAAGEQKLRKIQEEMAGVVASINSIKPAPALLQALAADHAAAPELLSSARDLVAETRQWVVDKGVVTLPEEAALELVETPAFLRDEVRFQLDRRRVLPEEVTQVPLFLSTPDLGWTPPQIEQHLRILSRPTLQLAAASEAYPGRYTQLMMMRRAPTRLRKLLASPTTEEGWALYAERIVLDAGWKREDPAVYLVALHRNLVATCRLVATIGFHTERLTLAQVKDLFEREAYLPTAVAQKEAAAVAADPNRLAAAFGELKLLELREDYLGREGASIREFHDAVLAAGAPPLKIVRWMVLPQEAPRSAARAVSR